MQLLNPSSFKDDVVRINAGGIKYQTTRATLCKYPNSVLGMMFDKSSGWKLSCIDSEGDGSVFLDVDGIAFGQILAWLRGCPASALLDQSPTIQARRDVALGVAGTLPTSSISLGGGSASAAAAAAAAAASASALQTTAFLNMQA